MRPFSAIYIENEVRDHPRVREILTRCPDVTRISCERYTEIFNLKAQNFRLQKRHPSLILAKKHKNFVLPAPPGYGFGNGRSYYFSHMLNCPYDCRYCFLQGMYRSAHYVLFVNYEDFENEIEAILHASGNKICTFYSGYDCDSLAFEQYSGFIQAFLPLLKRHPQLVIEHRTKSAQVQRLLKKQALPNCIIAMSFSPENIAESLEHRVPSLAKRIDAAKKLQAHHWPLALRFEPLIYHRNYRLHYEQLFEWIFKALDVDKLHSVSLGAFRMPQSFFKNIVKLYPEEPLFADRYVPEKGVMSYPQEVGEEMMAHCKKALLRYIPEKIYYACLND